MKIEQAHIEQVRTQFAELQSKEDLVNLLSDAKTMLYGEKCKPIQLKSLTYYANPVLCKKRYQTFTIKKKSGGERTINAPVKGLKSILRSLNFVLQCMYEAHEAATGFVLEKSIVDNAKKHVGHHYVLNMDLKDFFHTFDRNRVKMGFMSEPFNLKGEKEPLAFLLASLCTHPFEIDGEVKTVLPQGSPTSPTLTNILCKKLDRRLTGLAKRFGATYTRYADDITFSSPHNIYTDEEFNKELKRIIEEDQKLVINPKKTRLQKTGYRQEVTGLIVNDKVNIRRRYVKQIRIWLYYWEKYGYEKAEQIFKRDYIADKGHVKNVNAHLVNVLDGKLEFLKMVKGENGNTYPQLKKRFDKLVEKTNPLNQILNIWEQEGIEKAMNEYYKKDAQDSTGHTESNDISIGDLF
ncbi:MAG: RNA-directed DNA polymerase [Chitinophagaceae bacterium]|nr:RNA-directed DNA polymerase [Chitinophagaceae bacterium]